MSVESTSSVRWDLLDLADAHSLNEALAVSRRVAGEFAIGARAFNFDWRLGADRDCSSLRVFILRQEGIVRGFAVFSRRQRALKFLFGEVSLAQVDLTRFWHLGEPFLDPQLPPDAATAACVSLIETALGSLGSRECLFFEGLPVDVPMHCALNATSAYRARPVQLNLGADFDHQFIRMPDSFADYLSQLGSRSRQSLLYSQRRLLKDMDGDVQFECFESAHSVDKFVADATVVSRKTYQWNLLGLGLRDSEGLRSSLSFSAKHGWLRSFILYCKKAPVAFMLGSQQGDCYYYDDVGYDPAFAKSSVGSVLQLYVLEYLLNRADRPKYFDFSTGYGEHKGRFGNFSRRETNLLVMPSTIDNRALAAAYRVNDRASKFAVDLLARAGIKEKLKRMIRRRSSRKGEEE